MPAGEVGLIEPAGLMWSVVSESPKIPRTRAPRIGPPERGCIEKSLKNGGSAMYVDFGQLYAWPETEGTFVHIGLASARLLYSFWKVFGSIAYFMQCWISCAEGQMSPIHTSSPFLPLPRGSVIRSFSTVPARAYVTTSGGEARKFARRLAWMRASKLRLPESTAAHTRSFWAIASSMVVFSGPELPMQVVQP